MTAYDTTYQPSTVTVSLCCTISER